MVKKTSMNGWTFYMQNASYQHDQYIILKNKENGLLNKWIAHGGIEWNPNRSTKDTFEQWKTKENQP